MNLVNINPFRELDTWLNGYNSSSTNGGLKNRVTEWKPSVDIYENESEFVINAELAGVPKEDINVSLENNVLTISGERKSVFEDKENHRSERFYGQFTRSFSLPDTVNVEGIKAENRDGVLRLSLPKVEPEDKFKKIEIH